MQFTAADGKRRSIRLGAVSKTAAETVKGHVERFNNAKIIPGSAIPGETARWVADLDTVLSEKLAKVGLIQPARWQPSKRS